MVLSSLAIRARILSSARAFHASHARWPSRRELAALVGVSPDVLRYHANILIEQGALRRLADGALEVTEGHEIATLARWAILDYHILMVIRQAHDAGADYVTTAQLVARLAEIVVNGKPIKEQRSTVSRRCRSLIERGHLAFEGTGYRLVAPETT